MKQWLVLDVITTTAKAKNQVEIKSKLEAKAYAWYLPIIRAPQAMADRLVMVDI